MESVLASSPVWYQSRAADTKDGYFAFASRNQIYITTLQEHYPKHYGILSGHAERVSTCSFCHSAMDRASLLLVSGSDDCSVKVWNVSAKCMIMEHNVHNSNKITSVDWSPANCDLIVSGDEKAYIVRLNLKTGATQKFNPDGGSQQQLSCVTCSPFNENLVAVGYKSGAASVVDLSNRGAVVRKLRGHSNEIHSLIWPQISLGYNCAEANDHKAETGPTNGHTVLDTNRPSISDVKCEGFVVTGSKDRTIRLWDIDSGKAFKTLKLPSKPSKGRRVSEDSNRVYVALYWPLNSKSRFLSSSFNGDILLWDLEKEGSMFEVLSASNPDSGHHRLVFNILPGLAPTCDIITTSMDRWIKHWSFQTPHAGPTWSQPTLGGFVYAVAISPVDPSILALGVGDGMIRIWKTKNPRNPFDVTVLWQGIKEKVMSLSWHPTKEGLLAFGTEDGKVGLYDILSMRPPYISTTYHLKPVYSVSWGPAAARDNDELHLYTCGGEGRVFVHRLTQKGESDATDANDLILASNPHLERSGLGRHSEVAWSDDMKLLAIGNDDGAYMVFTAPHLRHVATARVHTKIVNCLAWSPSKSAGSTYLASGSNNSSVCVVDLTPVVGGCGDSEQQTSEGVEQRAPKIITEASRTLSGHFARITGLAWNPLQPNLLASSSYDGTAQVWDVLKEAPLANYRGHDGRLLCVAWSPVPSTDVHPPTGTDVHPPTGTDVHSPSTTAASTEVEGVANRLEAVDLQGSEACGLLYTGGDDYALHTWNMMRQEHHAPPTDKLAIGHGGYQKLAAQRKSRRRKNKKPQAVNPTSQPKTEPADDFHHKGENGHPAGVMEGAGDCDNINSLLERKKRELLVELDLEQPHSLTADDVTTQPTRTSKDAAVNGGIEPAADRSDDSSDDSAAEYDRLQLRKLLAEVSADRGESYDPVGDDRPISVVRRKRLKNLFPESTTLDNRKREYQQVDCVNICRYLQNKGEGDVDDDDQVSPDELGFYADRLAAFRMLHKEGRSLASCDGIEGACLLKLWVGDVVGAVEDAIEAGQLSDQIVGCSAMAGHDVWLWACEAFARQLADAGHAMHAAQYFIACNKVEQAIVALRETKHYREAVAIARARLTDHHPLLRETVQLWADKLKNGGRLEMAAKCLLSLGLHLEAAETLAFSLSQKQVAGSDEFRALFAASCICRRSGHRAKAVEYGRTALVEAVQRHARWADALECAQVFGTDTLSFRLLVAVHEIMISHLMTSSDEKENLFPHCKPSHLLTAADADVEDEKCKSRSSFFGQVLVCWRRNFNITSSRTNINTMCRDDLLAMTSDIPAAPTLKQTLFQISQLLATAVIRRFLVDDKNTRNDDQQLVHVDELVRNNLVPDSIVRGLQRVLTDFPIGLQAWVT